MKIMNKTLKDYFTAAWKFLVLIFILTAGLVFFRLSSDFPSIIQSVLSLVGLVVMILAGWSAVRKHRFNLGQAILLGPLLAIGIHWTLPIFHNAGEMLVLLPINTLIYSAIVFLGAWMGERLRKKSITLSKV